METIQNYIAQQNVVDTLISVGLHLGAALALYIVGRWLARMLADWLQRLLVRREVDAILVDFLTSIVNITVTVLAVIAALDLLGIPATSLLAVVGAAGLAIGLALKDSLSNFAAGVMLILFRPFTKGDYVEVGGESGTVEEVKLVSTRLVTPDNKEIIIPNGMVWTSSITNYSAHDTRRVDLIIGVGYDDDLKSAPRCWQRLQQPPQGAGRAGAGRVVSNLGDSSVDFAVRPWVKSTDYWSVYADILEPAKTELEAAGRSIPYPQTDVHLHKVQAQEAT